MGRYDKVYEIGTLTVKPNTGKYNDKLSVWEDEIYIDKSTTYADNYISLNIDEAKELITALSEIIYVVENDPQKGDSVEIIDGKLKGFTGRICDIDNVATEQQLIVRIDKDENHDGFYAYIDIEDVV